MFAMRILDVMVYCAASAALIAFPFWIFNTIKYLKRRAATKLNPDLVVGYPSKSLMAFAVPLLMALALGQTVASFSLKEALNVLPGLSGNYKVYVNHEAVSDADAEKIVSALQQTSSVLGHHSHDTKRIRVDINSEKGNITLELGRDSQVPQEYWVFYPKYRVTSNYEIGRIRTPVFDQY
jgi:hypothetical protein